MTGDFTITGLFKDTAFTIGQSIYVLLPPIHFLFKDFKKVTNFYY